MSNIVTELDDALNEAVDYIVEYNVPQCDFVLAEDIPAIEGFPNRSLYERKMGALNRLKVLLSKEEKVNETKLGFSSSKNAKSSKRRGGLMPGAQFPLIQECALSVASSVKNDTSSNMIKRRASKIEQPPQNQSTFRKKRHSMVSNIFN